MSKFNEIPAGYRITVDSWENDGDNYNTKSVAGLTENDVRFMKPLLELCRTKSSYPNCFGNMYDANDFERREFAAAARAIVERNILLTKDPYWTDALEESKNEDDENAHYNFLDYLIEVLYEYGLTSGEWYLRVMDTLTIEYIPETIRIEDVTDQF